MKSIASKAVADTDQWMTHMLGRVASVGNIMLYRSELWKHSIRMYSYRSVGL